MNIQKTQDMSSRGNVYLSALKMSYAAGGDTLLLYIHMISQILKVILKTINYC